MFARDPGIRHDRHPRRQCRPATRFRFRRDDAGTMEHGARRQPDRPVSVCPRGRERISAPRRRPVRVQRRRQDHLHEFGASGDPWAGHANYATSKGGIKMLMESMAQELAPQAHPRQRHRARRDPNADQHRGLADTQEAYDALMTLVPYGRIGEPEDIARAAVWLASDDSDYVVGTTLFVDGGMTLIPASRPAAEADVGPLRRDRHRQRPGRRLAWRTGWRRPASASCCWSAATICRGRPANWDSQDGVRRRRLSGAGDLVRHGRRAASIPACTTTSAAIPRSTARRCSACASAISARCSTRTASRPPGRCGYDVFEPYYAEAEALFHVHGQRGEDPTEPPVQRRRIPIRRSRTSRASRR